MTITDDKYAVLPSGDVNPGNTVGAEERTYDEGTLPGSGARRYR